MYKILLTLLVLLLIFSCGSKEDPNTIASVNDMNITRQQFDAYLKFKRIPADDQAQREKLLNLYLEREALAAVIEAEELLDKELIMAELNEFRKEMLISRYMEKYLKEQVTDQAVKNYYDTHAADYEDRKAHAAHILIRTNSKMSDTERKAKLTAAQEASSKIRAGEDFSTVAEDYSEDRISAKKGGDLGWIKEGSIDPKFSETLFSLKPGDVSEPVETKFGYHVIKLIEGPAIVKRPLDAVSGDIRYQLRAKAKNAELERLLSEVKIEKTPRR
jgi:peptidyl-prolyl cis-trans isomerase C